MHEINIYGDIIPYNSNLEGCFGFENLKPLLKEANGKDLKINIRSFGGECQTGFDIYHSLKSYAKEHNAKITTVGEGFVASIATVIFLAGDTRILTEHTEPFVHCPWTITMGESKDFKKVADDLDRVANKIANHYSNHTRLNTNEWLELMKSETFLTPEEALACGFCTQIEATEIKEAQNNLNNLNMTKQSKYAKILHFAKKASGFYQNKSVATADGKELDFYELGENDPIAVGAKAYYDGQDAQGEFLMPNDEKYVFVAGELTEIITANAELEVYNPDNDVLANAFALIEQMQNKIVDLEKVISNYNASSKPAQIAGKQNHNFAKPEPTKSDSTFASFNAVNEIVKNKTK